MLGFKRGACILLALLLASCTQNRVSAPSPSLLAVSSQDELWWLSLSAQPDAKIGSIRTNSGQNVSGVYDLAWDGASSVAWAVGDFGYTLYRVEVATGTASRVGSTGLALNGLAIDPSGRLIGLGGQQVYEVNPTTGAASAIPGIQLPCASSGDAAFANGLYASVKCNSGSGDSLVKVDLASKQVSTVGSTGFADVYGLSFRDGVLYGATLGGQLIRIDTGTGSGVLVRTLPFGVYGTQSVH